MSRIKTFNEYHGISESTFPRVIQTMSGFVDSISSIGIMSAQNPKLVWDDNEEFKDKTPEELVKLKGSYNKYAHSTLKKELREKNLGFHQVFGRYSATDEIALIIPNISRELITQLGIQFNQESVIWGEKQEGGKFKFYFINCKTGKIDDTVEELYFGQEVQSRDDFFTWVKGRKFIIPFFEEAPEMKQPKPSFKKELIYQRQPKHKNRELELAGWF
jgi:hypothetical protein